jgi:hypothetical protein
MRWASLVGIALCLAACGDPVREKAIAALGGEKPGVAPGPLHRPGQPCRVCHDGTGPGELDFSLAGTVFQIPTDQTPLVDALIWFEDSAGRQYQTASNCAGNFFVRVEDFEPKWPVFVKLRYGDLEQRMSSAIYRDGSCATCHYNPPGQSSEGQVYLVPPGIVTFPPSNCP